MTWGKCGKWGKFWAIRRHLAEVYSLCDVYHTDKCYAKAENLPHLPLSGRRCGEAERRRVCQRAMRTNSARTWARHLQTPQKFSP